MSPKERHEIPERPSPPSEAELRDVRQLINIFMLAWKNYGLYPETHESTLTSIENLAAAFNNYFSKHPELRLTVEKDRLLYRSETIHTVSREAPSEDILTLLYRDGIKWIAFQQGLPLEEIASFFSIAHKYRLFAEENEGDIVTALMDEELECIDFKAVDVYWQDLMLMNFSQLPPPGPAAEEAADPGKRDRSRHAADSEGRDTATRSIADPSITTAQLELSGNERKRLQQMVEAEERWDITDDLFELLLIILKNQTEEKKFAAVLAFIAELFVESIALEKFEQLTKLFRSLYASFSPEASPGPRWRHALIDRFFDDLSRAEFFQPVGEKLLRLQTVEGRTLAALEKMLQYFSPTIVPLLAPVITQSRSKEIRSVVYRVIVRLSRRDIGPLEKMAARDGRDMGAGLLTILSGLKGDRAKAMLFDMCDHPSVRVRRKAIDALLKRDPAYAQKLFPRIDDPAGEVRACVLAAFAKRKSSLLENMLIDYLQNNVAQKAPTHILACFRALGYCGSNNAVPFLRTILLTRGWNSFIGPGKPVFREGAALALAILDTPEAGNVLRQASQSRFKVIRKAVGKTKSASASAGKNIHE